MDGVSSVAAAAAIGVVVGFAGGIIFTLCVAVLLAWVKRRQESPPSNAQIDAAMKAAQADAADYVRRVNYGRAKSPPPPPSESAGPEREQRRG